MISSIHELYGKFFNKYNFNDFEEEKIATNDILNELSGKIRFSDLVSDYMLQIQKPTPLLTQTYFHDNGYYKIVLYHNTLKKIKLRLHIWPISKPYVGPNNIHNHRWDYYSKVIAGNLQNEIYIESNILGKDKYFRYQYLSKGNGNSYHLNFLGQSELNLQESITYQKGDCYFQPNNVLHRIVTPSSEITATLIITHESSNWKSNELFSEKQITNTEHYDVEVKSANFKEIEILLNKVYSEL